MSAQVATLALKRREADADPDRRDAAAISAARSICARSAAARTARRRRSISPPSAATAISCAPRSRPAGSPPATTCPMAGCWWRWPRWRWPAGSAPTSSCRRRCPPTAGCSARTRRRYLVATARAPEALLARGQGAGRAGAPDRGRTGASALTVAGGGAISVARACGRSHEAWLPALMGAAPRAGLASGRTHHGYGRADRSSGSIKGACPTRKSPSRISRGDGDHYAAHVVSPAFKGKSRVQQHQMVYRALGGAWAASCMRLALTTAAPRLSRNAFSEEPTDDRRASTASRRTSQTIRSCSS